MAYMKQDTSTMYNTNQLAIYIIQMVQTIMLPNTMLTSNYLQFVQM